MQPADYIDRHAPDLVRCLRELIRIPTVNPPGERYDAITQILARRLKNAGLQTRRFQIPAALLKKSLSPGQHRFPRFNVLGRLAAPGARRTLHFNAHYDVVPVSGKWQHGSAFSGALAGGWIYGRGTADMKGSMASLLLALQSLRATRTSPLLNLEVSFTADEETDSLLGTGWLVRNASLQADFAIVMEGGEGDAVCCGHNGVVWLEVTVHGRAAHGSRPEAGINALEKMSALVLALEKYKRTLAQQSFLTPEGKTMRPTLNIGGIFSCGEGGKINTVPAHASFTIDRRVLPTESQLRAERDLRAFLAAAARKIPSCRISIAKVSENFACFRLPTLPFFAAMAASVRRVRRGRPVFCVSTGFNDMHFFAQELKIPTLGYGPGGEAIHAIDERAQIRELLTSAKIYADLLTTFDGTTG